MIKTTHHFSPPVLLADPPPAVLGHCFTLAFEPSFCTRFNNLRPLNWRWQAGLGLVAATRVSWKFYDDSVRQLRKRLQQQFACSEPEKNARFWRRHSDLGCAIALAHSQSPNRPRLEAWLLSATPAGQIAEITGIPEKAIEFYASLFFDIDQRDCGFIYDVAVCRPGHPGPVESLATQVLKVGAWKGGRLVLEKLLELDDDTLAGMHSQNVQRGQRHANPQDTNPESAISDPLLRRSVMRPANVVNVAYTEAQALQPGDIGQAPIT